MFYLLGVITDTVSVLHEHFAFIERKCREAINRKPHSLLRSDRGVLVDGASENDADELFLSVIDHLQKDDCRVLRERRGDSSLKSYLASVIGNLHIDRLRAKLGRDRRDERAREFGRIGELLFRHCFQGDHSLESFRDLLADHYRIKPPPLSDLSRMHAHIDKQVRIDPDQQESIVKGKDESGEPLFDIKAGAEHTPEGCLREKQRAELAGRVVQEFRERLDGTESLIFSLKFPEDGDEAKGKSFKDIAHLLNIPAKKVERSYYGCLTKFREILLARGVRLDDLVDDER